MSDFDPPLAFRAPFDMSDLAEALRNGRLPLLAYLDQLAAHFAAREPAVLSFVPEDGRCQRLRCEAQELLARYPNPATRPLLFGLPVGVKDIFHAAGFVTQAGCRLPAHLLQGNEAESVRRLRAAGALIVGKTATTEFAYFAPATTRNPHNPAHTPGGSSSGSAAAVSAGLCLAALGTQTIGSIGRPAAFCGVVGYKPTYERISRDGVLPLSPACDHVGLFAPDVAGAALVARVLVAGWRETAVAVTRSPYSMARPILGIPEGPYLQRATPEGQTYFRATVEQLRAAGFTVRPIPAMSDFDAIDGRHRLIVAAEAAQVHGRWFAEYSHLYHPKTAELMKRGQAVDSSTLTQARAGQEQLRHELTRLMDEAGIDAWLSPSATGPAPAGLDNTGDPVMNLPWTHAGLPTLTIPAGISATGLPLGLQLTARWQSDEEIFGFAAHVERALQRMEIRD